MLKRSKKITSVLVVLLYLFSLFSTAFAQPADIAGNPSAAVINRWLSLGLAQTQPDGTFKPNQTIQRIEFFTYINKIFNFADKSSAAFTDVISGSWYGDEIAKAVAAGYLQGDKNKKVYPFVSIKKADAAVILAKLFDLQPSSDTTLQQFDDEDKIPAAARDAVSALVERGYAEGRGDSTFGPFDTLTRVQAIQMINAAMGELVNKAGIHTAYALDNMIINTKDAVISNSTIKGNLYITEGVGNGNVTLDNVIVKGKTYVRGGGESSITVRNSTLEGALVVNKKDGKVRVVTDGTTSIPLARVASGARLEEANTTAKGFEKVQITGTTGANQEVRLKGNFTDVTMEAAGISLQEEGNVSTLTLKDAADNASFRLISGTASQINVQSQRSSLNVKGGTVGRLDIKDAAAATKVVVEGTGAIGILDARSNSNISVRSGTVSSLVINSGAAGSSVQIDSGALVSTLTASGSVDVNGRGIISTANINVPGVSIEQRPGTTNVANGVTADVGGTTALPVPSLAVNAVDLSLVQGVSMPSGAIISPASGVTLNFTSSNPSIASVNSTTGVITGIYPGTTVITVTATRSGYNPATATFNVNVGASNTTIGGVLAVSPGNAVSLTTQTITLTYTPGETLLGGNVVFTLPAGFTATTGDTVSIAGAAPVNLAAGQLSDSGQTVTFTGLTLTTSQSIVLTLVNKTMPAVNPYNFTARADVDGAGSRSASTGSGSETRAFASVLPNATLAGSLAMVSSSNVAGMTHQTITLTYTPGQAYANGTLVFTLPSGITAADTTDTLAIAGAAPAALTAGQISGQTVTVTGLNITATDTVELVLNDKTIPAVGTYAFSASGDADGAGLIPATAGTGNESKPLTTVAPVTTTPGTLVITPVTQPAGTINQTITLTYTLGENFTNGEVRFNIPAGFTATGTDTITLPGGSAAGLAPGEILDAGQTVAITGLTANSGDNVVLTLIGKTIPAAAAYSFTAVGDADGSVVRPASPGTGSEAVTFTVTSAVATAAGSLAIAPATDNAGATQTLVVTYTPGEALNNGTVVFTLPSAISAVPTADTITIAGGAANGLTTGQINGQTVTITGVTTTASDTLVLTLTGKVLPATGTYHFKATADADGTGLRPASAGTGNEAKVFTTTTPIQTADGSLVISPVSLLQGLSNQTITFTYTPGENLVNGTVVFTLPTGFTAVAGTDTVTLPSAGPAGLTSGQITNSGKTVTVTGVTATSSQTVIFTLNGKTVPAGGTYNFKITADADGAGVRPASTGTGSEQAAFISDVPTPTTAGTLVISPNSALAGMPNQNIALTYTLGQNYTNGTVEFTLASGLVAAAGTDTVSVAGGSAAPVTAGEINGLKVTISNITANAGQTVVFTFVNRTVPAAGTYTFSVKGDADGAGIIRTATAGSGNETKVFTSLVPAPTTDGTLVISPISGISGVTQTITVTYTPGEALNNGTVVFTLPSQLSALPAASDTYKIGSGPANTLATEVSGQTVTLTGVTTTAGQTIILTLVNKTVPTAGTYTFKAKADADGVLPRPFSSATGTEVDLYAAIAPGATLSGTLALSPLYISAGTIHQTLTLTYTPGESLVNGNVVFTIPAGFSADIGDSVNVAGAGDVLLIGSQITNSGHTVTITNVTASTSQTVVLTLTSKTIPPSGLYQFTAISDADGAGVRPASPGIGSELRTFTATAPAVTSEGSLVIAPTSSTAGATQSITLTYTPGEDFVSGSVVFTLPAGFTATTSDTINIAGTGATNLVPGQITSLGQKVTITNVTATSLQTIVLTLVNKTIPTAGTYNFSAKGDADDTGVRPATTGTGAEVKVFTSNAPIPTSVGSLTLSPLNATAGLTNQTITLSYAVGEDYSNGKVVFTLPAGVSALAVSDTVSIAGGLATGLSSGQISNGGQTVTITGVNATNGQTVVIRLNGKTIPAVNTYNFSAAGDVDDIGLRPITAGTGAETKTMTTVAPVPTAVGALSVTFGSMTAGKTNQSITLVYTPGESFSNGTVVFTLPAPLVAVGSDTLSIAGAAPAALSTLVGQVTISGQTVTVTNVNTTNSETLVLVLTGRTIPPTSGNPYAFKAAGDADGVGIRPVTAGTGNEAKSVTTLAPVATAAGSLVITPTTATAGLAQTLTLTYTLGDTYTNGTLAFTLPSGITANTGDTYSINGAGAVALSSGQISGQTVTVDTINASNNQTVVLTLTGKTMPGTGTYNFSVVGDADGTDIRPATAGTGAEAKNLTIVGGTTAGSLVLSPAGATEAATQTITLTYTPGEAISNGTVVFTLPSGFAAVASTDKIKIAAGTQAGLTAGQISGQNVTVTGVTATTSQTIVLTLVGKTVPAAGTYNFSASADADGAGPKPASGGTGNETQTFTTYAATTAGTLTVSPTTALSGSAQTLTVTYTVGENYTAGTVVFSLPAGIAASTSDTATIAGGTPALLSAGGQTVTISGLGLTSGQTVVLTLVNKVIPVAGIYSFSATGDADGSNPRPATAGTGTERVNFISGIPPAAVTTVSATNVNGTYGQGQNIYVTVKFSVPVTVSGNPTLMMDVGGSGRAATYLQGSNSDTLTFLYTVQTNDTTLDLEYTATGALALNGGSIKNTGTTVDADVTLPAPGAAGSLSANKGIVIDTVAPTLLALSVPAVTDTSMNLKVDSSEGGTAYYIVLPSGATIPNAAQIKAGTDAWDYPLAMNLKGTVALDPSTWTGTKQISGLTGNTPYIIYAVVEDAAGNLRIMPTSVSVSTSGTPDTTPPTLSNVVYTVTNNTSLQVQMTSNKNGKVYYVILPSGSQVPSAIQVKAGLDASGAALPAGKKGNLSVSASIAAKLTATGLTPLANYDIHLAVEDSVVPPNLRGTLYSGTFTTNVPADTVPPVYLVSPAVYSKTNTVANIGAMVNEDGKMYYVALPASASAPSAAQVKAGTNAAGAAQTLKGSVGMAASTDTTLSVTGLTASTAYNIYVVAEDALGNLQATPVALNITTDAIPDTIAPNNAATYPKADPGDTNITLKVKTDESGKAYYVALYHGMPAPNAVQVKQGRDGNNNAPAMAGSISITANTEAAVTITGLSVSTTYDIYVVSEDAATTPNLQSAPAKIIIASNPLNLTGVGVDIAAGQITGTSVGMQYSFDATSGTTGTWAACKAGNTPNITFAAGKLYVRETVNSSNFKLVADIAAPAAAPDTAGITYDVAAGTISGMANNTEYRIGTGNWTSATAGATNTIVNFTAGIIKVRTKATPSALPSLTADLGTIYAAAPAPGLTFDDVANTITGLNTMISGAYIYEYKVDAGPWTPATGAAVKFDGNVVVQVRLKAMSTSLAGIAQSITFTQNMDFSTVILNIAAGQIYGTTTSMQYSLDSTDGLNGTWKPCTSSPTAVNLANAVNVYIRAGNQTGNFKRLAMSPAAPTYTGGGADITVTDQSGGNNTSIRLALTNSLMEYSRDGGNTWSAVAQGTYDIDVSSAPNNDLRVRFKAQTNVLASVPTPCLNPSVDLSTVGIDVANNTITGTSNKLEYCLNFTGGAGDVWTLCSAPVTTGLTFTAGKVSVRAASQTKNYKVFTIAAQLSAPVISLMPTATTAGRTKITMLDPTKTYQYLIDSNAAVAANSTAWSSATTVTGVGFIDNVAAAPGQYIHIREKGTSTALPSITRDTAVQLINIRPGAAPGVQVNDMTSAAAVLIWTTSGTPVVTTDLLEYSLDGSAWTDVLTSTTFNLNGAHVLYVRVKATTALPASDATVDLDTNP